MSVTGGDGVRSALGLPAARLRNSPHGSRFSPWVDREWAMLRVYFTLCNNYLAAWVGSPSAVPSPRAIPHVPLQPSSARQQIISPQATKAGAGLAPPGCRSAAAGRRAGSQPRCAAPAGHGRAPTGGCWLASRWGTHQKTRPKIRDSPHL